MCKLSSPSKTQQHLPELDGGKGKGGARVGMKGTEERDDGGEDGVLVLVML